MVEDSLDERIVPEESDDRPSAQSVTRWRHWLMANIIQIDGYLKSIGYRELGFSTELLKSGISLLQKLRSSVTKGWLNIVLKMIYNSGGRLPACYS